MWMRHRVHWYTQMDALLNVEHYLERFFQTDSRLADAREELRLWAGLVTGTDEGFSCLDDVQQWVQCVEAWHANLRSDMLEDSVLSPDGQARWLLYAPAVECDPTSGALEKCWLCRKCREAFAQVKSSTGEPAPMMPALARASGLVAWTKSG